MSEPWTTKQESWVKEQYLSGRKVGEFYNEFEPLFGIKRTKTAFYQKVKKFVCVDGLTKPLYRNVWSEEEIARLVKLHGYMKVPGIARVMGRTRCSVEGQVAKMRREGTLAREKRERVCWLGERERVMEREWGV